MQGRIHEVGGPEERIAAIAQEHPKSRRTLRSFHPTTALAQRLAEAIQSKLKAKGVVGKEEDQTRFMFHVKILLKLMGGRTFEITLRGGSSEPPTPGYFSERRRSAFAITETELKLIAAAASIGLSNNPNTGYRTPAASGTPSAL